MLPRKDISFSMKELKRMPVIENVIQGRISNVEAGEQLSLTDRQVRNLVKKVKEEGVSGLVHKLRGRPSNRRHDDRFKQKVLDIFSKDYHDFGPTLASEKLLERNQIEVQAETLRLWLLEDGKWQRKRKRRKHRRWRERKKCYGEMSQFDGSHHDWFEGRCEHDKQVLLAFIDDATNDIYARFYTYEGTLPAMDIMRHYFRRHGMMQSIYLDKLSAYKSKDESEGLSQVERAAKELSIEIIHAHSPQAKGRVERLFETLQDRLIKELRLAEISNIESANIFLETTFLPSYNQRFAKSHRAIANVHRKILLRQADKSLCIKDVRRIRNDNTIQYDNVLYQIERNLYGRTIEIRIGQNRKIRMYYKDQPVKYKRIKAVEARRHVTPHHKGPIAPMPLLLSDHRRVYG